jgi:putative tricarboxylic transport membrane protein
VSLGLARARFSNNLAFRGAVLAAAWLVAPPLVRPEPNLYRIRLIAPGSPGGGYDLTARAMKEALEAGGIVSTVEVVNSPGAGGAIALAQFVGSRGGDADTLLVGGQFMIDAIRAQGAVVSLAETTPLARLIGEYQVVAAPSASDLRTIEDVVEALRTNPGGLSWAGGSSGGPDQLLAGLIARAAGVDPIRVNYVPSSGGGEAAAMLRRGQASIGVSGYPEFESHIRAGALRALAISAPSRLAGIDVPTLKERGVDVVFANWRGVFAPPGLSEEKRALLLAALEEMVGRPEWRGLLASHHWTDLYLAGEPFGRFVQDEQSRAGAGVEAWAGALAPPPPLSAALRRHRTALTVVLLLALAAFLAILLVRRQRAAVHERDILSHDLESAREDAKRLSEESRLLLDGLGKEIDRQFDAWGLTPAEREVGLLLLKGLRHKEIAQIRNTSERTVRQQALSIYRRAGLEGRTDLAAYFLEDLLAPGKEAARQGSV